MRNWPDPRKRRTRQQRATQAWCALSCMMMGLGVGLAPSAQSDDLNVLSRTDEWWLKSFNISDAWQIAGKGEGQRICLVDSGVDATHPDLQGANFADGTDISGYGAPDGLQPVSSGTNSEAKNHGTAMAAWIVGQGHGPNHSLGVLGVAPEATIISVSQKYAPNGTQYAAQRALSYCAAHGATIANFSNSDDIFPKDVAFALNHNIVIVQSNGNNVPKYGKFCSQFGLSPGELGVTGSTADWYPDPEACPGGVPNTKGGENPTAIGAAIAAPSSGPLTSSGEGEGLLFAIPEDAQNNRYEWDGGGTSTAAAITSGVVALVRERYPQLSASAIIEKMMYGLQRPAAGTTGRTGSMGFGLINPVHAVTGTALEVTSDPLGDPRINSRGVWSGASFSSFLKTQSPTPAATSSAQSPQGSFHGSGTTSTHHYDKKAIAIGLGAIGVVLIVVVGFFIGVIVLLIVMVRRLRRRSR